MSFVNALRKERTFPKNKTKNHHPSQDFKKCVPHALLMTKNKKQKSLPRPPKRRKIGPFGCMLACLIGCHEFIFPTLS
jgi:hypothetical protein